MFHSSGKFISNIRAPLHANEWLHNRFEFHDVCAASLSPRHRSSHRPSTSLPIHVGIVHDQRIRQRQRVTKLITEYLHHVRSPTAVCSRHSGSTLLLIALTSSIMHVSTPTSPSFPSDYTTPVLLVAPKSAPLSSHQRCVAKMVTSALPETNVSLMLSLLHLVSIEDHRTRLLPQVPPCIITTRFLLCLILWLHSEVYSRNKIINAAK